MLAQMIEKVKLLYLIIPPLTRLTLVKSNRLLGS
jgi:hypothetical protein